MSPDDILLAQVICITPLMRIGVNGQIFLHLPSEVSSLAHFCVFGDAWPFTPSLSAFCKMSVCVFWSFKNVPVRDVQLGR